eukprot:7049872-Prorocentrum_lima.AAC.1
MLEADEQAAENGKPSWQAEEAPPGNSADVERKGGMQKNDTTNTNTSYTTPKAPPCRSYQKTG